MGEEVDTGHRREREWTGTNEVKKWTVQRERERGDAGHGVGARVDSGQGEGQ